MDTSKHQELPKIAWDWLTDKTSLTKRLKQFTQNKINFCLIQDWQLQNTQYSRKIEWRLNSDLWIKANLLLPQKSVNQDTKHLLEINTKPIGEILFEDPSLTRTDFLFHQESDLIWTRESIFYFKEQPITLIETFYSDFFKALIHAG